MVTSGRSFGPSALATPANAVTLARLAATPLVLILVVDRGASWWAIVGWAVLASTDGFDGYLARRQGTTRSGAFLDPLADKFLVVGVMAALVAAGTFWWLPVAVIAIREVGISVYRSSLGRHGVSVPARNLAKLKTITQLLAVGFALLPPTADATWLANGILWIAVALTVVTGVRYLQTPAPAAGPGRGKPSIGEDRTRAL